MKTIILTKVPTEATRLAGRLAHINPIFQNIPCHTKDTLTESMDCEIIFSTWYMPTFTIDEIRRFFPKLRAIFYAAGTVKQFASPFIESGVRVFSAAKANCIPVAEFTTSQIILANKGYFQAQRKFRWPIWRKGFNKIRHISAQHQGNYSSTIGILGCGAVGSMVVELLRPYNIHIKVYDPYLTETRAMELGVEKTNLENIFSSCNVISNHMPDIPETKDIIDKRLLQRMIPYATFINTGRGAQINETDLISVLRKRKDLSALLDVTKHEPSFPWSGLYWSQNIYLTPHIAGSMNGEIDRMIDFVYQQYENYQKGEIFVGEITLDDLKHNA